MSRKKPEWEVVVKDDRAVVKDDRVVAGQGEGDGEWEIAVVRSSNTHGKESYGWSGEDKILISDTFGDGSGCISKNVFDAMLRVAKEICDDLNAGRPVHIPVESEDEET